MKKYIALACLVVLSFGLMGLGGSKEEPAATRIAVINLATVYQESKAGKAAMTWLEALQSDAVAKLETVQVALAKAVADKDEEAQIRLEVEIQGMAYTLQNALTQEQERVVTLVTSSLNRSLEEYIAANKLVGIMTSDSFQAFAPEADVTKAIIAMMDAKSLDFGDKPSLDLPAAATPLPTAPVAPQSEEPAAPEAPAAPAAPEAPTDAPAAQEAPADAPAPANP